MIELNRILCPVDFSPFSEHALHYSVKIAKWSGATLHVLHVFPMLPPSAANQLAAAGRVMAARTLEQTIARYRLAGVKIESEIVESGEAAPRILERAAALNVDLIVAGSHGRTGIQRALLGSVVEGLLHQSRTPLLVVPSHADLAAIEDDLFKRIVCAVDFTPPSLGALALAFAVAEEADGQLTLLHVIELPPELAYPSHDEKYDVDLIRAQAEAAALTKLRALIPEHARDYCTVQTEVLEGGASKQILRVAEAEHANLIVLGAHGRNAFDLAFFGSNAKDAVRHARCPVLVVPVLTAARHAQAALSAASSTIL